jgi:nucleoside-diphosphate-sugar epimerase
LAKQYVTQLSTSDSVLQGRIQVAEGDITQPGLGLGEADLNDVTEVWHVAAACDLAVSREVAFRVNVEGTRNVLDAVEHCPRLTRLHYFSTCYVSGCYPGPFGEDDLEVGAPFNNYYEETKWRIDTRSQSTRWQMRLPRRQAGSSSRFRCRGR